MLFLNLLLAFVLFIIHQTTLTSSITNAILQSWCSNTTMFANNSAYQTNLNTLLRSLSSNATNNPYGYYRNTVGDPSGEPIYGHYLCRGDQNTSMCHECVNNATTTYLPKTLCPNMKVAHIWTDFCMVRYSNVSFFNNMDLDPGIIFTTDIPGNATEFYNVAKNTITTIAAGAAEGGPLKKFDVVTTNGSIYVKPMYGYGQCTPDLTPVDCHVCLISSIGQFLNNIGGQFVAPSCIVRFENYSYFDPSYQLPAPTPTPTPADYSDPVKTPPQSPLSPPVAPIAHKTPPAKIAHSSPPSRGNVRMKRNLYISMSILIPVSVAISIALYFCTRRCLDKRKATETFNKMGMDEIIAVESLQFDLNTIRSATSNFSADNKLGKGGFGEVYKGKFESGQEIAVKRLSKNSTQGIVEFKTEVILVAKLQHRNLVKLLGFCVASTETILVYEFLPNSSLDRLLFEPTKKACLDWQTRFKIILGIARGLLYLHEDSRLKVIHRDLKSSNILLDEGMNPKISDFGLAKLFGVDETQGDTRRIVGTYGYMAPEYACTGHYSVKSDVYSFGVLLLEIVSGQRNRLFRPQHEEALLHRAWRLWTENKALDLVDTTLCNFPREQLMQCIHIGLLCIHEDAFERPRMALIVAALNGHTVSLSSPKAPHFFRSGTSDGNSNALDEHISRIYTGGDQMTELYSRD